MTKYFRVKGVILYDNGRNMEGLLGLDKETSQSDLINFTEYRELPSMMYDGDQWQVIKITFPVDFPDWNPYGRNENCGKRIDQLCELSFDESKHASLRVLQPDDMSEAMPGITLQGTVVDVYEDNPRLAIMVYGQVKPRDGRPSEIQDYEDFVWRTQYEENQELTSAISNFEGNRRVVVEVDHEKHMYRDITIQNCRLIVVDDQLAFSSD